MAATEDIVAALDENEEVQESYVLVRDIKLYLRIADSDFSPQIKVKIYQSSVLLRDPFHFGVSHHVHTPMQAGPYHPSNTSAPTEHEAIRRAIDTTTSFIKSAIALGHEPSDSWLIVNDDF